ncbi:MAG: O-antigen ligase family protein [Egibacteraceae bacterium]
MLLAVRRPARDWFAIAALPGAAAAACIFTAASMYAAFIGWPFVGLSLVIAGVLVVVTLSRPPVGVGAAVVLFGLSPLGLTGSPAWLLPTAWSAFVFGLALTGAGDREGGRTALPRLAVLVIALLMVAMVSAAASNHAGDAIPIVRPVLAGLMLFVAATTFVRGRDDVACVLAGVTTTAIIVGGFTVWEYVSGAAGDTGFLTTTGAVVTRVSAGFGSPNQLAGFLVLLLPGVVAGMVLAPRGRLVGAAAIVLTVAGVYVTFSRGALIALVVIPLFFIPLRWSLLLVPVAAALLLLSGPALLKERFGTLSEDGSEVATRADFWRAGVTMFGQHPLAGVGPGGFPEAYSESRLPGKQFLPGTLFKPPPHAHNLLINTAAEQGLLGLGALIAALVSATQMAGRLRRRSVPWVRLLGRAYLAMLAAFMVHNLFDVTLLEATMTVFLGLLGLLSAVAAIDAAAEAPAGV